MAHPINAHANLQAQINDAKPHETIIVTEGTYEETITIDKPLRLIGEGNVRLHNSSASPIITVLADGVTLDNLSIVHDSNEDVPAILLQSDRNTLNEITIETSKTAILLDEANENTLQQLTITGDATLPIRERKRGIDFWKSHHNEVSFSKISFVEDGIYEESSQGNIFHDNLVTNSRYGYHLMFTDDTEMFNNESYENISGMMIMGTRRTIAYENIIKYNQKNVQSLGVLLFDVTDAKITSNEITHNRVGIFVEDAWENEIANNNVAYNFVGLQFKRAEKNKIIHNTFLANVVQGEAEQSADNVTNENYWSDHMGVDRTGDGTSDFVYTVDPFFLHLTNKYPPYRLLFQSPGIVFLDQMLHTPREKQLVDEAPLIENPLQMESTEQRATLNVLFFSLSFFIISLFAIILGVKKT